MVISPGSRNAPLIFTFTKDQDYRCISAPDERVAAFVAMGLTLKSGEPVAVLCSSGSAVVNFYPAVVEAFYQRLPLLVLSADRPSEMIDQAMGQTIKQDKVFENHVVKSFTLIREPIDSLSKNYNQRSINEAMMALKVGPVHINIPFNEPLYEQTETLYPAQFIATTRGERTLDLTKLKSLANTWNNSPKIWVLVGQMRPSAQLEHALNKLNDKSPFLIFSETLSNLHCANRIPCIDRLLNSLNEEEKEALKPDLVLTLGGEIVSKVVKNYLRNYTPKAHWHINERKDLVDTFNVLTDHVQADPSLFLEGIELQVLNKDSSYRDNFINAHVLRVKRHEAYMDKVAFSDLAAFNSIQQSLPLGSILHCANSTSIRYAQLFEYRNKIAHYANRGTSGIDGCTSTAIGHALSTEEIVVLVTGDLAFLYDSNAFWLNKLPSNLRVLILNNEGGNIFRIIDGPKEDADFEEFQETHHQMELSGIAKTFDLPFETVASKEELDYVLKDFFALSNRPKIMEIKTPRLTNPSMLREYFQFLKNG